MMDKDHIYSDVPLPLLEVISEAETDEIENFSRGSSLPGFAEETQDDFEETMMSEEQGSNETIVQANEGIANMISVETTMVHNPKTYGTVEEVTFSNSNSQKTQLPTFRTFYETDESELEPTESVESVVLRPTHANQAEIVLSESKSPAQALNIENARSQSEVVVLDIDLSKPQESHACGDIPIQINLTENNNLVGSDVESEIDAQNQNSYTDTESDFQFLPQRTESLTKAIEQKERPTNGATGNQSAADENIEEVELDKQGCSCAKLCVIT
ncbi:hypothetical protein Ocin01_09595 [Orchesella cincta]|uniref:Uncharacterized protein n=1 Tax=Orchesella cincta TaxID=48709 RepID=A0A1D2MVV8_ORCCI|nr:hypothetical protein Ocin01_09595 [Orchesella cincta]